ncbi:hypothetical protein BDFB_000169, partial [Asbolus verrucosus]
LEENNEELCDNVSSFTDLYKYSSRTASFTQKKRRELFLQKQKEKRCEAFDEKRDLSELFTEEPLESMEYEASKAPKVCRKFPFSFKLMESEWLTEMPEDLADSWLVKLCPQGVRYLVVAHKGITTCYLRNGRPCLKFKSNLPGGSVQNYGHRFTVLDCIYNKDVNSFFVYDVLAWNSMSLINAEAHMRFCWLKSKFAENPEICITKHPKNFHFILMDFFPAQNDLLQEYMFIPHIVNECEMPFEGVLFYHKEGHYVFSNSPLVGWLKTFMLPKAFNIDVHHIHLQNKPENYESVQQYLNCKKKRRKNRKSNLMEMEQIEAESENIECDNV